MIRRIGDLELGADRNKRALGEKAFKFRLCARASLKTVTPQRLFLQRPGLESSKNGFTTKGAENS